MHQSLKLKVCYVSWFQTGLDIQGFEAILESVFGPAGFFPNNMMQSMLSGADELIMSKVRNSSAPLSWLASLMDLIMSQTPIKDLQAAGAQALTDTKDGATDLMKSMTKVPEPVPEPEVRNCSIQATKISRAQYIVKGSLH